MHIEKQKSPEEDVLHEMHKVLATAQQEIEAEFARTTNPWMLCFGSIVFTLGLYLILIEKKKLLSPEKYAHLREKFKTLEEKFDSTKKQYPTRETTPSEELKQELIREFDVFRDL